MRSTLCAPPVSRFSWRRGAALQELVQRKKNQVLSYQLLEESGPDHDKTFRVEVTLNGQVCFDGQGEFRHQSIDRAGVERVVEQVEAGLYEALFMTEDDSFISGHSPRVLHNERHCGLVYKECDPSSALELEIMQMCAFVGEPDEHLVTEGNPYVVTARWCDDFCDVIPMGGGKPEGVRAMCERFGFTLDEAVAFGDGGNDISMLQAVGTGVAMGNAGDNVKAAADYVTTGVDDDGIWNACKHLGLI